jgi:tricorn protease
MFRRIVVWSVETGEARPVTDAMAHAVSPAWDRDGRHLWFLASTDLGPGSWVGQYQLHDGPPTFGAYVTVLRADDPTPFTHRSDEEGKTGAGRRGEAGAGRSGPSGGRGRPAAARGISRHRREEVRIDFPGIERRIVALPMPVRTVRHHAGGAAGSVFIGEHGGTSPASPSTSSPSRAGRPRSSSKG